MSISVLRPSAFHNEILGMCYMAGGQERTISLRR